MQGNAVFIHRPDSSYRDIPSEHYQFPRQYLTRVEMAVGEWIVYYEPTKLAGSRGYFAVAQVEAVRVYPESAGMFLALIEPGSYCEFGKPVPFGDGGGIIERGLLNASGKISGRAQSAVRPLSRDDFLAIVGKGLEDDQPLLPRVGSSAPSGMEESSVPFLFDFDRQRVNVTINRAVRDRSFRKLVLNAYSETCAVTGLKLINGGGRAEVEAAHIRPVEHGGPDSIQNGIPLSGTAHWMFDRGLIGVSDDFEILISRHVNDNAGVRSIINRTGKLMEPRLPRDKPHIAFLRWHREHCFKT